MLGSAKSRIGDHDGAARAYDRALAIDKNNVAALVNGGTSLRDLGLVEQALSRLIYACKVAPNVPEAYYNLGDIYLATERFSEAANAAEIAINLSSSMSAAHVLRVLALEASQAFGKALNAAETGLSLIPMHYGLHYERARMLRSVGNLLEAEKAFKKCIDPRFLKTAEGVRPATIAYAHNEYAALLSQLGRNEEARVQWRRSVKVDPSFAQGWVNAASHEDGIEQSLSMYKRAIDLSPGLVEAWINVGQVYYNSFRQHPSYMSKALESFERARAVAPDSSSALYSLARTKVDLCDWHGRDQLFDDVARRMRRDLAGGTLLTSSISLVPSPLRALVGLGYHAS